MRDTLGRCRLAGRTHVLSSNRGDDNDSGWPRPAFWLTVGSSAGLALLLAYEFVHLGLYNGSSQLDDGVYFGEGVMLAHGILPYHSYLDLQPPGVAVIMAPFGLLGRLIGNRLAFELATGCAAAVSVANIWLLGWLLRRRHWIGVLTGLAVFGFYLDSLYSEHTIVLEPFLVLGTLVAWLILFDDTEVATTSTRRWLLAGVVLGMTTSVKLWEVIVVAFVVVLAAARGRRCVGRFVVGLISGFGVVCVPFMLLAPGNFLRQVVAVQLTRSHLGQVSERFRLWNLLGAPGPSARTLALSIAVPVALWLILLSVIILSILVFRRQSSATALTHLDACALACAVVVLLSFLGTTEFDRHYGVFLAPFLAIVLSGTADRLLSLGGPLVKIAAVVATVGYVALSARFVLDYARQPSPTASLDRLFIARACVLSESYEPLIVADRYNLYRNGCPHVLDIYGTELADANGQAESIRVASSARLQADWLHWLRNADGFVLFAPIARNPDLGPVVRTYFYAHFSLASTSDGLFIYRRDRRSG